MLSEGHELLGALDEREPESFLLCQQLPAGAFIAACSWLSPELLGTGTTNLWDAACPEMGTVSALWTHTRMRL